MSDERAATLLGAVAAVKAKKGYWVEPGLQARMDEALRIVKAQLAAATLTAAWEAGQSMSMDTALSYALD